MVVAEILVNEGHWCEGFQLGQAATLLEEIALEYVERVDWEAMSGM